MKEFGGLHVATGLYSYRTEYDMVKNLVRRGPFELRLWFFHRTAPRIMGVYGKIGVGSRFVLVSWSWWATEGWHDYEYRVNDKWCSWWPRTS